MAAKVNICFHQAGLKLLFCQKKLHIFPQFAAYFCCGLTYIKLIYIIISNSDILQLRGEMQLTPVCTTFQDIITQNHLQGKKVSCDGNL